MFAMLQNTSFRTSLDPRHTSSIHRSLMPDNGALTILSRLNAWGLGNSELTHPFVIDMFGLSLRFLTGRTNTL